MIFNLKSNNWTMNLDTLEDKRKKRKERLIALGKAVGIGIVQGGISTGLAIIPALISVISNYFIFGVLFIWLVLGWFSTYLIRLNTLEILATLISGGIVSLVIYYFAHVSFWFISLIIGLSMLFWVISFITKIFIFPPSYLQKQNEINDTNLKNEK